LILLMTLFDLVQLLFVFEKVEKVYTVNELVPVVENVVVKKPIVENHVADVEPVMLPDDDIKKYIEGQKAKTTKYKDFSDLNIFTRFCKTINEYRYIEEIPPPQLDNILCQFFMNVKTLKGKLYEPDSLSSIRNSLQRVLEARGSSYHLREDVQFEKSRKVLASRRKELTKQGKGNKPNAARPISNSSSADIVVGDYKTFWSQSKGRGEADDVWRY